MSPKMSTCLAASQQNHIQAAVGSYQWCPQGYRTTLCTVSSISTINLRCLGRKLRLHSHHRGSAG